MRREKFKFYFSSMLLLNFIRSKVVADNGQALTHRREVFIFAFKKIRKEKMKIAISAVLNLVLKPLLSEGIINHKYKSE